MIFPVIKSEKIVQVNDATRIDVSATVASEEISSVEIKPEASEDYVFVDVLDKRLDWVYATEGQKIVSVRINADDATTKTHTLTVVTEAEDALFSSDSDIIDLEMDILNYCKNGRNSHINRHRKAQELILAELWKRGKRTDDGEKITKDLITITPELNEWSKYLALYLIYNDFKNEPDGIMAEKAQNYKALAESASSDKQFLKIDLDGDGTPETVESGILESATVVRR